jgi:hypothetical protein
MTSNTGMFGLMTSNTGMFGLIDGPIDRTGRICSLFIDTKSNSDIPYEYDDDAISPTRTLNFGSKKTSVGS